MVREAADTALDTGRSLVVLGSWESKLVPILGSVDHLICHGLLLTMLWLSDQVIGQMLYMPTFLRSCPAL